MKTCDNGYWSDYFCEWMCGLDNHPCIEHSLDRVGKCKLVTK